MDVLCLKKRFRVGGEHRARRAQAVEFRKDLAFQLGVLRHRLGDDVDLGRRCLCIVGEGDPAQDRGFFPGGQAAAFDESVRELRQPLPCRVENFRDHIVDDHILSVRGAEKSDLMSHGTRTNGENPPYLVNLHTVPPLSLIRSYLSRNTGRKTVKSSITA